MPHKQAGASTVSVKIDRALYDEASAEAKQKLRTIKVHIEEILRRHFKAVGREVGAA